MISLLATGLVAASEWRWELVLIATPMALEGFLVMARLRDVMQPENESEAESDPSTTVVRLRDVIICRQVFGSLAAGTVAAAGRGLGAFAFSGLAHH